jgi:hypothetical protein
LNEAYALRQVWVRSFQISPSEIGVLSEMDHHVSFQKPGGWRIFSDEPSRTGETADSSRISNRLAAKIRKDRVPVRDQLKHLDSSMLTIFRARRDESLEWRTPLFDQVEMKLTPLQRISYLARSFFDCQFFVATEKVQP